MAAVAKKNKRTNFIPQQTFLRSEHVDHRQHFRAVVIPFSAKYLANVAGVSIECAKNWKAGRYLPQWDQMRTLALSIPQIREYVETEIDEQRAMIAVETQIARMIAAGGRQEKKALAMLSELARKANGK